MRKLLLLAGVGVIVIGVVVRMTVGGYLSRLPLDFSYAADIYSRDNLYDQTNKNFSGQQNSETTYYIRTTKATADTLQLENIFSVKSVTGEPIFSVKRNYAIDRTTGKHVSGGDAERSGYLFAPRNIVKGDSYTYWHPNYNQPLSMSYAGEETILGLKVYRFETNFTADQTKELSNLPDVGVSKGIRLYVQLTTWIEPTTGRLIKYQDVANANYYDIKTGKELHPWNSFSNHYSQASIAKQVQIAQSQLNERQLFLIWIPLTTTIIGLSLIGFVFLGKKKSDRFLMLFVGVIGLGISIAIFNSASINEKNDSLREYTAQTDNFEGALRNRLTNYEQILRGGKGLFEASDEVTGGEWRAYVDSVDTASQIPGALGIGYSEKIGDKAARDKLVSELKKTLHPNFSVKPVGERREYHAVLYLEPQNVRNVEAIGFDMFQEPVRRQAMEQARDTNAAVLSGKLSLVQEIDSNKQSGFILFLPIYQKDASIETLDERRSALKGYAYAPFRVGDFVNGILSETAQKFSLTLYSDTPAAENILYDNGSDDTVYKQSTLRLPGGRVWIVHYHTVPSSIVAVDQSVKWKLLVTSLTMTILLIVLLYSVSRARARAEQMAYNITLDLREKTDQAKSAAEKSEATKKQLKDSQDLLVKQNDTLNRTKRAMMNVMQDLAQEKEKLQAETIRFESMVESLGDALLVTDEYAKIMEINPMAEKLLGVKREQVLGKWYPEVMELFTTDGEFVPMDKRPIMQAITNGKAVRSREFYISVNHKTQRMPVAMTVAPLLLNNQPMGVVEVFRDITKERELDQAKDDFVSLVSHQLRTPATAVKQFLGMIREGYAGKVTTEQEDFINTAYESNERQIGIIDDLLNVSRLDLGKLKPNLQPTDITALVKDIHQLMLPRTQDRKQKFELEVDTLHTVQADQNIIRMAIENFVDNASKYTPDGGTVKLAVTNKGKMVNISVSDNGVGIAAKDLKRLFKKFSRIENSLSVVRGGSGLGLYIAQKIIELHHGKLSVESKLGKGTTFTIHLKQE